VGVDRGASLEAWAAKFPCAEVLGLNVRAGTPGFAAQPGRYRVGWADQISPGTLVAATEGLAFDLIVDDGGHSMRQQQGTLQALWRRLRPCGLFVVEDLHTSHFPGSWWDDARPTTLDLLSGAAQASAHVDMGKVLAEAASIRLYTSDTDGGITGIIRKHC